jgi:hypothetical protein
MKVTILTAYTNNTVADQIENLIQQASTAEPDVYNELNFQRSNGGLVAEWFHPNLGEANLDYREGLYRKIHDILPPTHLAIIEDEESQEIITIGDLGYFKQVIQQAKSMEELEEVRERIDQTEISNPLLKQILHRAFQMKSKALRLTVS